MIKEIKGGFTEGKNSLNHPEIEFKYKANTRENRRHHKL